MSDSASAVGPARRNLVARFRSLAQARKAFAELESRGFDAASIRLEDESAPRDGEREPERPGSVMVAVGSDDPIKIAQAQEALRDLDPIEVQRLNERGEPV